MKEGVKLWVGTILLLLSLSIQAQVPELIATGFIFTEGPCWIEDNGGSLLFSDIGAGKVFRWSTTSGVGEYIPKSGNSNGLAIDLTGNIILAQQGSRQIGKLSTTGTIETLCSTFEGKKLNSPNDLIVRSNGTIYFTDPDYGVNADDKELNFNGVFFLQPDSNEPQLLINDLLRPNGIAFSPDEWNLYVCDAELKKVFRYEMKADGLIRKKYEFANIGKEIDGIKTDLDGKVYVAVSDVGIYVYSPKGILLQTIKIPEKTTNLAWGDKYRNSLYITAGNSIYRVMINPDFPFVQTELLSRPTESSITLSMMAELKTDLFVTYGLVSGSYISKTPTVSLTPDTPCVIELSGLYPGKTYYYRVCYRIAGEENFQNRSEFSFSTKPNQETPFSFVVQADPHLDESSNYQTYLNALQNTLNDNPDFMIDLGDNFMSDKLPFITEKNIGKRALLFRHFFEKAAHSVPLFMVLGNHEAEAGWELDGSDENVAIWNTKIRKLYFPNPEPNQFYSGDSIQEDQVGLRQNYYAWNWGNALFVVIDPYWYTNDKPSQNNDGWQWTLGEAQYRWLKNTLEKSTSKYKFIFSHQLVGGDIQGRGGAEMVKYFEMGGYNTDGSYAFDTMRPGWGKPLHRLFIDNGVSVFFHGHDHFYARQELDGVIYQLVPQPSLYNYSSTQMAAEYGYTNGTILPNSGHLKVTVSNDRATVDYISAYHEDNQNKNEINGKIQYSYSIGSALTNPVNISEILGRPTNNAITLRVLFDQQTECFWEYGFSPDNLIMKSTSFINEIAIPLEYKFENLKPNTRYYYRTRYRANGDTIFQTGDTHTFITQRAKGTSFQFTVEADPHPYDKKGYHPLWEIAMQNQLNDGADFLIDMGDTFGDDHNPFDITDAQVKQLHLDALPFFGRVCHSSPLFLCLGNHEGESGYYLLQNQPNNLGISATKWRKFYYPNPFPDGFYSGNNQQEPFGINWPENYYSWEWGDALFIVLDVYRYYTANAKPRGWEWTMGKEQYDWFTSTLENSNAKYKLVFAHHVLGETRGGIIPANENEWGGYEPNGKNYTFNENRQDWGLPIHQLMVKNKVDVFFQGHDHLFAKEILDSIIYQTVPMPDDSSYMIGVTDNGDAFNGVILNGSGHLRVTVNPDSLTVDYVSALLPRHETAQLKNNQVVYSYSLQKQFDNKLSAVNPSAKSQTWSYYPNPATDEINLVGNQISETLKLLQIINTQGKVVRHFENRNNNNASSIHLKLVDNAGDAIKRGLYIISVMANDGNISYKKLIVK
jgi:sugar lactone lactonase YvrE/phosphodiesterase/alkaline phosphatase D-like protein